MEDIIIDIIKNLIAGNLTFIGLIFTSLGIILNIKDNWKTKKLRESNYFDKFILNNVLCVVFAILLIIFSFIIILLKFFNLKIFFWITFSIYSSTFLYMCYLIIDIVYKYYKLISLLNNDNKPIISINSNKDE